MTKDQSDFNVFSSKQHVKKTDYLCIIIKVVSSYINSSMPVRNLGLLLDNTLRMEKQANSICKSCYYQIRNTGLIHMYVNDETCKTSPSTSNSSTGLWQCIII